MQSLSVNSSDSFLIFLDTETSGLNPETSHILEIALVIINELNGEIKGQFQASLRLPDADYDYWKDRVDLWTQACSASLKINGWSWEKMENQGIAPRTVAKRIVDLLKTSGIKPENSRFYCQNPSFDRGFFNRLIPDEEKKDLPYLWLDLASADHAFQMQQIKALGTPKKHLNFSKDAIAQRHGLPPEAKPHGAMNGVLHLIDCYEKVVGFPFKKGSS